jgi:NitT/TauT family transport system ATP-binding protein
MTMSPKTAVDLGDVTYRYDRPATAVLSRVSFAVRAGEFVAIVGPSGCGKSTLLKLIGGLLPLQKGTISVAGLNPTQARQARSYGFVFQTPALSPWRNVRRNLQLPLEVIKSKANRQEKVEHYLQLTGLSGFQNHLPDQLSGGMQQLVAIGRALILDPAVLLLDEPFGSLDAVSREAMNLELTKIIHQTAKTTLLVTHSIEEAVFLSDRVLVMSPRPAHIFSEIKVAAAQPRHRDFRKSDVFFAATRKVRQALELASANWQDVAVISGEGRGKTLGFPTLNLDIAKLPLGHGVYAAVVTIEGKPYHAVMHYGPKSTFGGQRDTVEVFVLDFEEQQKTRKVDLKVKDFIRSTMMFDTAEELIEQMRKDTKRAREILGEKEKL